MNLLKEVSNEQAAVKAGIYGGTGAGKTTTAALAMLGISIHLAGRRPVAMADTESGSDYLLPIFQAEGVKLLRSKSRAFADLLKILREAEGAGCCGLIADSVTHYWRELCDSFKKRLNVTKLEFHHWQPIKREWGEWTAAYLNSCLHIWVLGRLGYDWEYQTNEESGKKELIRGESKMKVETEFGYEPSLLIEMERIRQAAGSFVHRATVLKDRTWALNGTSFDFTGSTRYRKGGYKQVFRAFLPHFRFLNIGGKQLAVDVGSSSEELFDDDGQGEWGRIQRQKKIALELIEAAMVAVWPGTDQKSKRIKASVLQAIFGTRSWTEIEGRRLDALQQGARVLEEFERVSREHAIAIDTEAEIIPLVGELLAAQPAEPRPPTAGGAGMAPASEAGSAKPRPPAFDPDTEPLGVQEPPFALSASGKVRK